MAVDYKKELLELVEIVMAESGSDIHFGVDAHPVVRVSGALIPLVIKPVLTAADLDGFAKVLMEKNKYETFLTHKEVDFSYSAQEKVRFRGNGFMQSGNMAIALRLIPNAII